MTIKHIQDQIENYALQVARAAYLLSMKHQIAETDGTPRPNADEISDQLKAIVHKQLQGE